MRILTSASELKRTADQMIEALPLGFEFIDSQRKRVLVFGDIKI